MANAARSAELAGSKIGKAFDAKNLGATLATAIGLNLTSMADKLVAPFREAAEAAKELANWSGVAADAQERMLKLRMDDNQQLAFSQRELKRLIDMQNDLEKKGPSKSFFGFIGRGSAVDKALGFSRREDLKRETDLAEIAAKIAEKQLEIEVKKEAVKKKAAQETKKVIEDDLEYERKKYEYAEKGAELDKELQKARGIEISDTERLAKVTEEIQKYESFIAEGGQLTNDGKRELIDLLDEQKALTKEVVAEEEKVTENLWRQNSLRTVGMGDKDLSDRELERKARALNDQILSSQLQDMAGGYDWTGKNFNATGFLAKQALSDLTREQDMRRSTRSLASSLGEDAAFMLSGLSESRFREILSGSRDDNTRQTKALETIADAVRQGLPVVNLNL